MNPKFTSILVGLLISANAIADKAQDECEWQGWCPEKSTTRYESSDASREVESAERRKNDDPIFVIESSPGHTRSKMYYPNSDGSVYQTWDR